MLTSEAFWNVLWVLIAQADRSEEKLKALLASEPKAVIVAFEKEFWRAISNLEPILCGDGWSEDNRNDLFGLIVSRGREYYDEVVSHPEIVPDAVDPEGPYYVNVAGNVLWEQYGEEIYDH